MYTLVYLNRARHDPRVDKGHRNALRAAARQLVREKGLSRTTARDLVEASGTNLRSIGYHFGSKDELMGEVLAHITEEWNAAPVAASRAGAEGALPQDRMLNAVRTMLTDLISKREDLFVLVEGVTEARHSTALSDSLIATQAASLSSIADSIVEGAPGLPREIAMVLSRLLMAVHDGLALQQAVTDDPVLHDVEGLLLGLAGLGVTLAAGLELPGAAAVFSELIESDPGAVRSGSPGPQRAGTSRPPGT